jgi:hypothetical protein
MLAHDPFHPLKAMNEAVNDARNSEHRRLPAQGEDKNTRSLRFPWARESRRIPDEVGKRTD